MADYYETLGVDKNASSDEIKNAYRKKAKKYHPDLNPDNKESEKKFKEVNEAYEVLSDASKKSQYDQFGHETYKNAASGAGPGGAGGYGAGGYSGFSGFEDIFDSIFGGGFGGGGRRPSNGPKRGRDLQYNIMVSLEEAAFGITKEVSITREEKCSTCSGTGAKDSSKIKQCSTCHGTGQVQRQTNTIFGTTITTAPCDKCKGTGKVIEEPCKDCRGSGSKRKNRTIKINIPAGINDGQAITMRGEGEVGSRGGPNGDLYIVVNIKPHKKFKRRDDDLLLEMDISVAQAILGDDLVVPTLDGEVKYKVPAGTQPGTVFKLRDKGVNHLHGKGSGDLYVKVNIEIPKKISDKQKELIKEFDSISGGKKSIFSKVKKAMGNE